MDFQPPEFNNVPYGSHAEAPCAPPAAKERSFRGITIRTPERVLASQGETISLPVCGYYQLATLPLVQGAVMSVHVRSTDGAIPAPIAGEVVVSGGENEPDIPNPDADAPIDPALYAHSVSEDFFYLDGQLYLPQPLPPGNYEVCVTYGEAQSNVARVQIVRR
ncbi:MAG: hypothetical protein KDE55_04760 [Novosphingobium sp.]|nr:hypothetical protein [Novosphingobium sp.]